MIKANSRKEAPAGVPAHVRVHAADWSELGADSEPVDRRQLAYGPASGTQLMVAMAAEVRAGRVTRGTVADRRTGEVVFEYPPPADPGEATKAQILGACAAAGCDLMPENVIAIEGEYTIDGMPWAEWLEAMTDD